MAPFQVQVSKSKSRVVKRTSLFKRFVKFVFDYLSKLRSVFNSAKFARQENFRCQKAENMAAEKLSVSENEIELHQSSQLQERELANKIVNEAILYGCAEQLLEQLENYFRLKKSEKTAASRKKTLDHRCARCTTSKSLIRRKHSKSGSKIKMSKTSSAKKYY